MHEKALIEMGRLAKIAKGPIGLAAKASLDFIPNPHPERAGMFIQAVDAKKLAVALTSAGFVVVTTNAVERARKRIRHKRHRIHLAAGTDMKLTDVKVHDEELLGKTGYYVTIHHKDTPVDPEHPLALDHNHPDVFAFGRSDSMDDALLQAVYGALREGE